MIQVCVAVNLIVNLVSFLTGYQKLGVICISQQFPILSIYLITFPCHHIYQFV